MKKDVEYADFGNRLEQACDGNKDVPLPNHGRLQWFVEQLEPFGIKATPEGVRKWFRGITYPRLKTVEALAMILKVDRGWLSVGTTPNISERQARVRNTLADGVVNVVTGFIEMDGGHPAYPEKDDKDAERRKIDIYAIIRGAKYSFHVVNSYEQGDEKHCFAVPIAARENIVLGVVRGQGFKVDIYELDWEGIEIVGDRKPTHYEFPLTSRDWKKVSSFKDRI